MVTASPAVTWASGSPSGVASLTTRLTLAPPRLGSPASAASGSGTDGLSPLITSTASLAPRCASVPADRFGPLQLRQQADLQGLAAGRRRGGVVAAAGAGGCEGERGDEEQEQGGFAGSS